MIIFLSILCPVLIVGWIAWRLYAETNPACYERTQAIYKSAVEDPGEKVKVLNEQLISMRERVYDLETLIADCPKCRKGEKQ